MKNKKRIRHKDLLNQVCYNPKTGYFYWITTKKKAGTLSSHGYIVIGIDNQTYYAHILAWFYIYGYWPENDIDHKDRIRHHNWIDNLRESSRQCNSRNCGNPKNNTSGVKGVYWDKQRNKWRAQIVINYKDTYIGIFKEFHNAVYARLAAEQCVGWEGCDGSSPAYQYVQRMRG